MTWWARLVPVLVSAADAVVHAAEALVSAVMRLAVRLAIPQLVLLVTIASRIAAAATSLAEGVRSLADSAGYPAIAWELAKRWDTDVIDRLRALPGPDRSSTAVRGAWIGPASDEYLMVVEEQHDAAGTALTGAEAVRDSLRQSTAVVVVFYVGVIAALAELAHGLVAGAVAAGTGVGVGPGVASAGMVTAEMAVVLAGLVAALWAYQTQPTLVADQVADSVAATWPRLRPRLFADASSTDGDDTDWHIRR